VNCEEFQARLAAELTGEAPAGDERSARSHREACRDCGSGAEDLALAAGALRKAHGAEVRSPDLSGFWRAAGERGPARPSPSLRRRYVLPASAAAGLLLTGALLWGIRIDFGREAVTISFGRARERAPAGDAGRVPSGVGGELVAERLRAVEARLASQSEATRRLAAALDTVEEARSGDLKELRAELQQIETLVRQVLRPSAKSPRGAESDWPLAREEGGIR